MRYDVDRQVRYPGQHRAMQRCPCQHQAKRDEGDGRADVGGLTQGAPPGHPPQPGDKKQEQHRDRVGHGRACRGHTEHDPSSRRPKGWALFPEGEQGGKGQGARRDGKALRNASDRQRIQRAKTNDDRESLVRARRPETPKEHPGGAGPGGIRRRHDKKGHTPATSAAAMPARGSSMFPTTVEAKPMRNTSGCRASTSTPSPKCSR